MTENKKTTAKTTTTTKTTKTTTAKKVNSNKSQLILELKKVKKNYGKVEVLTGISFDVYAGERIAIVGANGAGKSTLSEIIARVKDLTSGTINYYFEENGKQSKGKGNISKHIGIQFQDSSYPEYYKVEDLVKFVIGAAKLDITEKELEHLYKTFDLWNLRKEVARGLSGGQQQRLNILLAIVNNPKLLILDEVGTGLDVESRTKIKSYIKSYADTHDATILLVSHNSDEVMELVDRVIVIHNGNVFEDKKLKDIITKWKQFDLYMNNLYLKVFKKNLDLRANKSGRNKSKNKNKNKGNKKEK
ncbi:MAG: multidrug ABC transporter ATP-binding protein [Candidatus Tyloplasma litorale]|nr:MAG: multidrug ABC transporter ATP-binding protein [Mycoplasmatales bacterium]